MDLIPIECGSCKAKLKIKATPSRMPAEVKCPKCGKPIPLSKKPDTPSTPTSTVPPVVPAATAPAAEPPVTPPPQPPVASASATAQLTPPPKASAPSAAAPVAGTTASPAGAKKAAAPIVLGQVADAASTPMITAKCPNCQWQTKVSQALSGKKIRCKQCSGVIQVASIEPAATTGADAATTPVPPAAPMPPAAEPVAPAPVAPPAVTIAPTAPATVTPPITAPAVAPADMSTLSTQLDEALRNSRALQQKLNDAERATKSAETRAQEAERALHDIAGKMTVEGITSSRKIAELESKVAELNTRIAGILDEYRAELDLAEKRAAAMRAKIAQHSH